MSVVEQEGEGLEMLIGERVVVFCMNYIYSGKLTGVNKTCILLEDAGVVFETGAFTDTRFKDFQKIGHNLYIQTSSIESFSKTDKT